MAEERNRDYVFSAFKELLDAAEEIDARRTKLADDLVRRRDFTQVVFALAIGGVSIAAACIWLFLSNRGMQIAGYVVILGVAITALPLIAISRRRQGQLRRELRIEERSMEEVISMLREVRSGLGGTGLDRLRLAALDLRLSRFSIRYEHTPR